MHTQAGNAASESVGALEAPVTGGARGFLGRAGQRWRQAAHVIGVVQTRFIMVAIYIVVVVPTGVLMRLFRDPMHLRPPVHTNWTPARQEKPSLESARRQF